MTEILGKVVFGFSDRSAAWYGGQRMAGDDRHDKATKLIGSDELAQLASGVRAPDDSAKPTANGSNRLHRDRIARGGPTVQVDLEEIGELIDISRTAPADVVALDHGDRRTQKMEAGQFHDLLREASATPAANPASAPPSTAAPAPKPAARPRKASEAARPVPKTTTEMDAAFDAAFADFDVASASVAPTPAALTPEVVVPAPKLDETAIKSAKPAAMIVADHRFDTQRAAIRAITKPPPIAAASPEVVVRGEANRPAADSAPPDAAEAPVTAAPASESDLAPWTTQPLSTVIDAKPVSRPDGRLAAITLIILVLVLVAIVIAQL